MRPLGVAAVEDKVLQRTVAAILEAIYETDFLGFSYGYRPNRSPHQALDALAVGIRWKKISWILDADNRGFFDTINHEWLMKFLNHRIGDQRILRIIQKWLKAGVIERGKWESSEVGTWQGSSISPLLANIYLHYTLDMWVAAWRKRCARGDVIAIRWADDFVIGFQHREDAKNFRTALEGRLNKFSLELSQTKTQMIRFGRFAQRDVKRYEGKRKPKTFDFLGMTHICGQTQNGKYLVHRKTIRKRLTNKLHDIKGELRKRMHQSVEKQGQWIRAVTQGYFGYHAIPGNIKALETFHKGIARMWYRTLRRRSQKSMLNWSKMNKILNSWMPKVENKHPWPEQRLERYLPKIRA